MRWLRTTALAAFLCTAAAIGGTVAQGTPSGRAEVGPQVTNTAVPWLGMPTGAAPCPEGMTRSGTLLTEGFGSRIPHGSFNNGWYRYTGLGGTASARSIVQSSNTRDHVFLPWTSTAPGTTTMLAFGTRGSSPGGPHATVNVNSVSRWVDVSGGWSGRVYDVTPATSDEGGRLGTWFEHISRGGQRASWDIDNAQLYTCRDAPVSRLAGQNRFETAVAVSSGYPPGQETVYVARADAYPDALGGAALAASEGAPLLLVRPDGVPNAVATELDRLDPERIIVLGGPTAVSDTVVDALATHTTGPVERLAGDNRFETAVAVSSTYPAGQETVYVATGRDYPDALTGGALAGHRGSPMLFVDTDSVPGVVAEELARLAPQRIVVLGGPVAVSESVVTQLQAHAGSGSVTRIAGDNRYHTAARVAAELPTSADQVYLATGLSFPDALTGSARAGSQGAPVLLTKAGSIPGDAMWRLGRLDASSGIVLGGQLAVHPIVMDLLGGYVG